MTIREIIMASKSLKKVRRMQLITLLDKQGKTYDQDESIERIVELYTELYEREESTITHTDPNEVSEITIWEVKATLRNNNNGTALGKDHINIKILKAGEDTNSKTFAKLYTKYTFNWYH